MSKVLLLSLGKRWQVVVDRPDNTRVVEFIGNRCEGKRLARMLALRLGFRSWWNEKATGELVEIPI